MKVPVSGPLIYPEDIDLVVQAAKEGWFTEGKYCARFARKLEQYTGFKHCVLCNSGSSANLLAVTTALRLSKNQFVCPPIGDFPKIITCATGFPTTIFPIIQCGAVPLFVDIDLQTLNINMKQMKGAADQLDTVGIIVAHTLGFPFDEEELAYQAHLWDMFVISDCSDALGATINGTHVGMYSDMATCSFFPAHHICTGEGGAVFTNNDEIAEMLQRFSSWGRDCHCLPGQDNSCGIRFEGDYGELPHGYDHKYVFSEIGYNLKMTELSGALGLAQMEHIDDFVYRRCKNFDHLENKLFNVGLYSKHLLNFQFLNGGSPSPFGFPLLLKEEYSARDLAKFLQERGIESRPIFAGNILRHPVIDRFPEYKVFSDTKNSDYVMEHGLWIGLHPALSDEQIDWEIKALNEYISIN